MVDGQTKIAQPQENNLKRGFVKQVLSGDSVVLQLPPTVQGAVPTELTVYLANVSAPRLAKRPTENSEATPDEPYAWEAREFLRKKIVGQAVLFVREFQATSGREHGKILLGSSGTNVENAENVSESGVSAGWLEARPGKQIDDYTKKLLDLQEQAKTAKKGRWSDDESLKHVRNVQWIIDDPRELVTKYSGKQLDAVVEQVRDGSTIRAFLLPSFEYVTIALSGVKAPRVGSEGKPEEFGEDAKLFVELRLLQRDVKVLMETTANQSFIGTVLHPRGNIAEFLLKEGLAKCVDWSMAVVTGGGEKLREAERFAKEKRLRLWRSFTGPTSTAKNAFNARVTEIGLVDSLSVLKDNGEELKVYFSSLRAPRREGVEGVSGGAQRQFRPLYDIPFMFEAREFLRRRLLGKSVQMVLDYVQPKQDQFPEKICCTVLFNNQNVAVMLIQRGYARAVRHGRDDDNRSSQYDALLAAESQAEKDKKGVWADKSADKEEKPRTLRVQELQGDAQRSKQFLPYLQRSARLDGIVEFVASASRLRVYVPKESCLITFLLSGINAPRTARTGGDGRMIGQDEMCADDALKFTRLKALQRDVQIEVETMDKAGGFIGYMFVPIPGEKGFIYKNLSELLVESGLANVHFTADRSSYYNQLHWNETVGTDTAANNEEERKKQDNDVSERKLQFKKVLATEIYPGFRFAAQYFEDGPTIEKLMNGLQIEMKGMPTSQFVPKRQQLCAAKYTDGDLWHRAKVEGQKGDQIDVYYVDFGNRETLPIGRIAALPPQFHAQPPLAKEFQLALISAPPDPTYADDAVMAFQRIAFSRPYLFLNVEYKTMSGTLPSVDAVSLYWEEAAASSISSGGGNEKRDVARQLVAEGHALVEKRREARLQMMLNDYAEVEQQARKAHLNMWRYGDFTGSEL
uniref:Staphylococcal nuclease domain-containing protein n=1 Tax=Globodera rostochiensis TaxID=31243 RepID=A0A914I7I6_GLORO